MGFASKGGGFKVPLREEDVHYLDEDGGEVGGG